MTLTRSNYFLIAILICVSLALSVLSLTDIIKIPKRSEQTIQGPNPDGSWGRYEKPMIQVGSVIINTATNEVTIFLTIDIGTGEKYTTHTILPLDPTIPKEEPAQ